MKINTSVCGNTNSWSRACPGEELPSFTKAYFNNEEGRKLK